MVTSPSTSWWKRTAPIASVLIGLAVVAYWGHSTEWKFVSPDQPHNKATTETRVYWVEDVSDRTSSELCHDHRLPGCVHCNPGQAQVEKSVPGATDRERIRRALAVMDRSTVVPAALRRPRIVRFDSSAAVDAAGIDIVPAWTSTITEAVTGSAEVGFQPTKSARLTARAGGTTLRVFHQIGDLVRAGDVLALVDAAEVGKAKSELQVSLVQVRLKEQAVRDLSAAPVQQRQRKEAEAALKDAEVRLISAEQSLANLGFTLRVASLRPLPAAVVAERLQRLDVPHGERDSLSGNLLPVRAPMDGLVMGAYVVAGEPVDSTKVMFHLVDPRQLRLTVHVPPPAAQWIKVGQDVHFRPDSGQIDVVGRVSSLGASADEKTRTIPVWADVPNPDGAVRFALPLANLLGGGLTSIANSEGGLRASTLGTANIVLREESDAVLIPSAAIQSVADSAVVFVRDQHYMAEGGPKRFHVRVVRTGARQGNETEIVVGLLSGEVVATKGSKLLADELRGAIANGN